MAAASARIRPPAFGSTAELRCPVYYVDSVERPPPRLCQDRAVPDSASPPPFAVGSTAVRRDTRAARIWSATPSRVLADTGDELVLACWPGVRMMAPATWAQWLRTGDDATRKQAVPSLVAGTWKLEPWTWRDTTLVSRFRPGSYFSVSQFLGAGRAGQWYINFELPGRRTSIGIDTFDLLLDLVADIESLRYRWKDEDEYAQGRRLGLIDDALHARVDAARQEAVALLESRQGPFASHWSDFRPDPAWATPVLPADALSVPAAELGG